MNAYSGYFGMHELISHSCSVVVIDAASGVCELTNQRRPSNQLDRTTLVIFRALKLLNPK